MITQTIPSRRTTATGITNHQQPIDVRQNPGFSLRYCFNCLEIITNFIFLRTRPSSAESKKTPGIPIFNQNSTCIRESLVRRMYRLNICHSKKDLIDIANAWTITATTNGGRSIINGSFSGELDIPNQDNTEIINRVDQLEKEVKGRDAEIRGLTDRVTKYFSF
jgi:hypothetical protein